MSTDNQFDPFDMSGIGVDTPITRTQGEFDPYDMSTTSRKSIEIRRKINDAPKRNGLNSKILLADPSNLVEIKMKSMPGLY